MAFDAARLASALLELGLGLVFGVATVYVAIRVFDRSTSALDEIQELKRGNVAVGVLLASVVVAIAIVVRAGVDGVAAGLFAIPAGSSPAAYALAAGAGLLQLLVGVLLAALGVRLAIWAFDQVTVGVDEWAELRRGNVAVAIALGGVLVAVAFVIAGGVANLAAGLRF